MQHLMLFDCFPDPPMSIGLLEKNDTKTSDVIDTLQYFLSKSMVEVQISCSLALIYFCLGNDSTRR